jgi:hypothetical protein
MADIRFDTGVQSFQINGGVSVEFNPTDSEFAKKLFSLFEELESRQHEYAKRAENETDPKKILDLADQFDKEIREKIDAIFGKPICADVFKTNVLALGDGLPVWANLMLSVLDQMDTGFDVQKAKTNARVKQYTERWARRKR